MPKFKKGTPEAKAHMEAIRSRKNYEKMTGHEKIIMTSTSTINVPDKMLYINSRGDQKIINTLTKSKNITTRDRKPVINFVTNNESRFQIENKGSSKSSTTTQITNAIREHHDAIKGTKHHIQNNLGAKTTELNRLKSLKKPNQKQLENLENLVNNENKIINSIDKKLSILKFNQGNHFKSEIEQDKHDREQKQQYEERQAYIPSDRGRGMRINKKGIARSSQSLSTSY
jgi:hypothetical protein